MKLTLIAGARPNFMKIAPILHAISAHPVARERIQPRLVHTGQHYDRNMSETFFQELNIPAPDVNLECGGGSQAEQTAAIMVAFEKELIANPADVVLVVGDVTSTLACSVVAKKLNTRVVHVEAGIRSGDLTMPEEINRMVTDSITDFFFTTSHHANRNLENLGIPEERIHFVGNVMIDTLLAQRSRFAPPPVWEEAGLQEKGYLVLTLHRPGNVDEQRKFVEILEAIGKAADGMPLVFPVHPRTRAVIEKLEIALPETCKLIDPLGYLHFNYLVEHSAGVITDSGGITEETTVMGVPCVTIRENTERPETIEIGTNELVGFDLDRLSACVTGMKSGVWKSGGIPELWDGRSAERIVDVLLNLDVA